MNNYISKKLLKWYNNKFFIIINMALLNHNSKRFYRILENKFMNEKFVLNGKF